MATIGWTQDRTDEVLVPVIRDMNRRETEGTQSNLTAFFSGGSGAGAFAPRKKQSGTTANRVKTTSKRLEGALGKLKEGAKRKRGSGAPDGDGDEDAQVAPSAAAGRKQRSRQIVESEHEATTSSNTAEETAGMTGTGRTRQPGAKKAGRGRTGARARA